MKEPSISIPSDNWRLGSSFAEALVQRDAATLAGLISPHAVWHFPGRDHALAGDHEGLAAIAEFAGKVAELSNGTFDMDVHEIYGSQSGAVIAFTGRAARRDGRLLNNPTRLELRIADGHVTELWEFVWDGEAVSAFWR